MLIVCPSCASEYELDPSTIGPTGRKVRCATCRTSFKVLPPEAATPELPQAVAPIAAEPAPLPVAPPPEPEPDPVVQADLAAQAVAAAMKVARAAQAAQEATQAASREAEDAATETAAAKALEAAQLDQANEQPAAPAPSDITVSDDSGTSSPAEASGAAIEPSAEGSAADPSPASDADHPATLESVDHEVVPTRPQKPGRKRRAPAGKAGRKGGKGAGRVIRWVAIAACLPILIGLFAARSTIVSAVPQLAILYEKAGLHVNLVGLSFQDVSSVMTEGGGPSVLTVEGRILNTTRRDVDVPEIDVAIRGEGGELLYNWSVKPPVQRLEAGAETQFRARLTSPPPAGQRVQVTFKVRGRDVKVALN